MCSSTSARLPFVCAIGLRGWRMQAVLLGEVLEIVLLLRGACDIIWRLHVLVHQLNPPCSSCPRTRRPRSECVALLLTLPRFAPPARPVDSSLIAKKIASEGGAPRGGVPDGSRVQRLSGCLLPTGTSAGIRRGRGATEAATCEQFPPRAQLDAPVHACGDLLFQEKSRPPVAVARLSFHEETVTTPHCG